MIDSKFFGKNIYLHIGSKLNLPDNLKNFDAVISVMLIHHLIGKKM